MTERLFLYTAFAGTNLHNGTTIKQIAPYEVDGPRAVTRLFTLSNGAVFDADGTADGTTTVSYTHLRAHETVLDLVCRLLLEKKKHTIANKRRNLSHTPTHTIALQDIIYSNISSVHQ